jgi:hypothetical protein
MQTAPRGPSTLMDSDPVRHAFCEIRCVLQVLGFLLAYRGVLTSEVVEEALTWEFFGIGSMSDRMRGRLEKTA